MKQKSLLYIVLAAGFLLNQTPALGAGTTSHCHEVISKQETAKGIPQDLLKAIAKIESGISPWAINARGRSHIFRSKEAAASYVRELVDEGFSNFSVGCMQLHYASHRRNFKSIEAMLEPENNIAHAAKLIKNLERRLGSMERAIKYYHSPSPVHHNIYKNRVYGMWAKIRRSAKPKDPAVKTVSVSNATPQKTLVNTPKRSLKVNFGVGGMSVKKNNREKI
jgi:hypothetical protein